MSNMTFVEWKYHDAAFLSHLPSRPVPREVLGRGVEQGRAWARLVICEVYGSRYMRLRYERRW